ncbi:MAG: hypothetical protein R2783_08415 [Gelidibacter sp.]
MTDREKTELFKQADQILFSIYHYGNSRKTSKRDKPISLLTSLRLIEQKAQSQYILGENGMLAILDGSVEKYLENLRLEKELDGTIKRLTGKRLKYEIWNNIIYVLIGAVLASVPNLVNEAKNSKEVESLTKSISEINELKSNYQKQLNHTNTLILELKNEVNDLKNASK